MSARLAPSRFAGQSVEWPRRTTTCTKEMARTNEASRQPKQPRALHLRPVSSQAIMRRRVLCRAAVAMGPEWAKKAALARELLSWNSCVAFFFVPLFAKTYLMNYQPPGDRTTTDMLHFWQYFRLACSDLMYGGDKVMIYVIFCSRVKIGGGGTFAFPPSMCSKPS